MKTEHFELELLTRGFLGGANPSKTAELRASTIRGQMRWWFRALGGFKTLAPRSVREQESEIFGAAAGDSGTAGMLRVQLRATASTQVEVIGPAQVSALSNEKYFLWPFEQQRQGEDNPRASLVAGTRFEMRIHWRGRPMLWPSVQALLTVFGHLGSLGTRSRRAMGALGFVTAGPDLATALQHFSGAGSITVRQVSSSGCATQQAAVAALAAWLKGWRQHGQQSRSWKWNDPQDRSKGGKWTSVSDSAAIASPGFGFARRDHNEGLAILTKSYPASNPKPAAGNNGTAYRAAVGLPIGQRFSSLGNHQGPWSREKSTVNWEFGTGANKGRFASPVILRPYRIAANKWRALVTFVDAHKWPQGKPVYLNGQPRQVSLDLYESMKKDPNLQPWP